MHSHCSVAVTDTRIVSTVHLAGRDLPSNDLCHVIKATRKNAIVITCTNSPLKPSLPPRSPECVVLDEIEDPALKRDCENREEALRVLRSVFHKAESLAMSPTSSSSPTGSLDDLIKLRGSTNSSSPLNSPPGPSVIPPSESPRVDDVIAPPPPVTRLLHPTHKSHQANLSQIITDALKIARPSPKRRTSRPSEVVNPLPDDEAAPSDHSDMNGDPHDDEPIPSAQVRPPRPPVPPPPLRPNPRDTPPRANQDGDDDDVDAFNDSQALPIPGEDQQRLLEFHNKWHAVFSADSTWQEFTDQCVEFASEARSLASDLIKPPGARVRNENPDPPPPRSPAIGRPIARFDPVAARRIQGLYRHSKKRAARQLLNDNTISYGGTLEDAHTYFADVFAEKRANASVLGEGLNTFVPTGVNHENTEDLYSDISESEVAAKLRSAANTAPGADHCEYSHLKKIDPAAKILTLIFNRCQRQKDVPQPWKEALTILIYKKGDDRDVSNFRPIAFMSVIYKLLMGVVAKRLTRWSIEAGILSDQQKSARPSEGCYEHTFLLKSLVADARRRKQKLFLAWLDIRNAFGSVPHNTIRATLRHIGVPADLVTLIMNAYRGATTVVRTLQGTTEPIPVEAGDKQGCPLSPILFNLSIELILRMVKKKASKLKSGACVYHGSTISCLAYADDLVIIARSRHALQKLLDEASDGATILGFSYRPDKCASISLVTDGKRTVRTEVNEFLVQGTRVPPLENEESYRYLGVPIGLIHNIDDIPNIVPRLIRDLETIRSSLLAPWQKLDAIRTFIQPCLTYALRAGDPLKQSLRDYRSLLVKALRDICSLPTRASGSYFFASKRVGGLAFQDPTIELDLQAIVQAIRILSSSDEVVAKIAREELKTFVRRTAQSNPTAELITKYVSADKDPRLDKLNYSTHSSLWSRVRSACRRQHITFVFSDNNPPCVIADGSDQIKSKEITFFLHRLAQQRYADALMTLPDQGKVARCLTGDRYANGSSWHMTGLNIRFKDWRFIHRARLNVVPLNANKSRFSNASSTCHHCTQPETLPHVVCHCRPQMTQIRDRHNKIVDRLTNAVRFGKITMDKTVRTSGLRFRPDIVVEEKNEILIIDDDDNALSDAAQAKFNKYQVLKDHFISQGKKCEVYPFVVGALGAWYKQNELLLTKMGMTRRYKSLFRKLCCSDAIQGSTNIYRLHLGWDDATPAPAL